jgi:hypothetical protein
MKEFVADPKNAAVLARELKAMGVSPRLLWGARVYEWEATKEANIEAYDYVTEDFRSRPPRSTIMVTGEFRALREPDFVAGCRLVGAQGVTTNMVGNLSGPRHEKGALSLRMRSLLENINAQLFGDGPLCLQMLGDDIIEYFYMVYHGGHSCTEPTKLRRALAEGNPRLYLKRTPFPYHIWPYADGQVYVQERHLPTAGVKRIWLIHDQPQIRKKVQIYAHSRQTESKKVPSKAFDKLQLDKSYLVRAVRQPFLDDDVASAILFLLSEFGDMRPDALFGSLSIARGAAENSMRVLVADRLVMRTPNWVALSALGSTVAKAIKRGT